MSKYLVSRRGLMFVLSSPSGAGKSTLSNMLMRNEAGLVMSISATTRHPRQGEVNGKDYIFVSDVEFDQMIYEKKFIEHATVFGHRYGTPYQPVDAALEKGKDVLFDIDWQGAQQLKQAAREDVASVFILPPSFSELERRLRVRALDSEEVVLARMNKAADELSHWAEYDYIIVNRDINESLTEVRAILCSERMKRTRQTGLVQFVKKLQAGS